MILGESGGVKTMVWTGHWADHCHSNSNSSNGSGVVTSNGARQRTPAGLLLDSGAAASRIDAKDVTVRLSVDGLLSLAQQCSAPGASECGVSRAAVYGARCSPERTSPSSSSVSPERESTTTPASVVHFSTPLRVQTAAAAAAAAAAGAAGVLVSAAPAHGLLTTADRLLHAAAVIAPARLATAEHADLYPIKGAAGVNGHHMGLPASVCRPAVSSGGASTPTGALSATTMAPPLSMDRLWETVQQQRSPLERATPVKRSSTGGDPHALDYSVCSGRSVIVINSSELMANGHGTVAQHNNNRSGMHDNHKNGAPASGQPGGGGGGGGGAAQSTLSGSAPAHTQPAPDHGDEDEDATPMICMICDDKATGLHYGIITCEG